MLRFGKKVKLSPRFIGPYEVTEKVGPVSDRLALPLNWKRSTIFSMFRCGEGTD